MVLRYHCPREEVRQLRRADIRLVPLVARFAPRFLSELHLADSPDPMQYLNDVTAKEFHWPGLRRAPGFPDLRIRPSNP